MKAEWEADVSVVGTIDVEANQWSVPGGTVPVACRLEPCLLGTGSTPFLLCG